LCEVIAAKLGDPRTDPHGDPIPTPDGQVAETPGQDLGSLRPGQRGRVTRVSDRDPAVLRFLTAEGIALGDVLEITEIRSGGAVTVQAPSGTHLLSSAVTAAIRVEA
jgi:DtxR family Mn-dependent transcriptional regulator